MSNLKVGLQSTLHPVKKCLKADLGFI